LRIYGVDFTCAPRRAKPITVASGILKKNVLHLEDIERLEDFAAFEAFLQRPGPWIGGFDFPFSMPRELVRDLNWPTSWKALVAHCAKMSRLELRAVLDAYRNSRPVGSKYAHRATDLPAGSSSPMKLVNPPVALMFHEGAPRLLAAGVHVPLLMNGDRERVALEAYPGLLIRKQLGIRSSYKSDTRAKHTAARREIRKQIVKGLCAGRPLSVRTMLAKEQRNSLISDGSGDFLDATICAAQAAWASVRARYGLPGKVTPAEGWIISS
jgi:hypothetical protein